LFILFILSLFTIKVGEKMIHFVHFVFFRIEVGDKMIHFVHFVFFRIEVGDKIIHFVHFVHFVFFHNKGRGKMIRFVHFVFFQNRGGGQFIYSFCSFVYSFCSVCLFSQYNNNDFQTKEWLDFLIIQKHPLVWFWNLLLFINTFSLLNI